MKSIPAGKLAGVTSALTSGSAKTPLRIVIVTVGLVNVPLLAAASVNEEVVEPATIEAASWLGTVIVRLTILTVLSE